MLLPEKKIQVGPMYSVAPGDTLLSVAATMKTTVKMIMQHNPNIPEDGMIQPGQLVLAKHFDAT
jgi:LysM repeat protein